MNTEKLLNILSKEKIETWFDLGLMIDKLKEDGYSFSKTAHKTECNFIQKAPAIRSKTFNQFKKKLSSSGMAFITYHYTVDGVTVEIQKYAKALKSFFVIQLGEQSAQVLVNSFYHLFGFYRFSHNFN